MAKPKEPIIVKKVKKAAHEHHGGAWKIAYADFVTAMMAFFLLMWLISMTTPEQKVGLAEFFTPGVLDGAGSVLNGNALDVSGHQSSGARLESSRLDRTAPPGAATGVAGLQSGTQDRASDGGTSRPADYMRAQHSAVASIRQALQDMPEIAELSRNIMIVPTQEGIDISLIDQDGRAMFPEGSVFPYERTRLVLEAIAPTIRRMPNLIEVRGHTSATRPGEQTTIDHWSLTAGRALAVREILSGAGLPDERFKSITGRGDTEPAFPDNPYIAANRRVTITLLSTEPPVPPNISP